MLSTYYYCSCSVAQLRPTLFDPMDFRATGFPVLHHLQELPQTHVHLVSDAIKPSGSLVSPFFCLQSFPVSQFFPMSRLFASGGQSFGASASASVLPMNIQGWLPLGWTGLIKSFRTDQCFDQTISVENGYEGAEMWFFKDCPSTWAFRHLGLGLQTMIFLCLQLWVLLNNC